MNHFTDAAANRERCGSVYDTLAILEDASRRISDAVGALMLASRVDQQHGPRHAGEFKGVLEQTADSLSGLNISLYSAARFLESLRETDDIGAEAAPLASTRGTRRPKLPA